MEILSSVEHQSADILLENTFEARIYAKHGFRIFSGDRADINSQAWVAANDPTASFVVQHAWEDLPRIANRLAKNARKYNRAKMPRISERIASLATPIFTLMNAAKLPPQPDDLEFEIPDVFEPS